MDEKQERYDWREGDVEIKKPKPKPKPSKR